MPLDATQTVSGLRPGDVLRMAAARLGDSSRIGLLFKLGVSFGLIILVCRHVDGAALVDALRDQSAAWLAATTLLGLVAPLLFAGEPKRSRHLARGATRG